MPAHDRSHYRGDFTARSRAVRAQANANPDTRCYRCGQLARHGDPWVADHTTEGDSSQPLAPSHQSCNASEGARYGNRKRRPTSGYFGRMK